MSTSAAPAPTDAAVDRGLVVALDGPGSSGKSSVGAAAARALGYRFCDTGLLYRAVTWLALQRGVAPAETERLVGLADEVRLVADADGRLGRVSVGGDDVTDRVHGDAVDREVSAYARVPELRAALLVRQRHIAADGRIVMAGRDIGTVVLPDADLKLYLDASAEERAARRAAERGLAPGSPEAVEILEELRRRDGIDSSRTVAPLKAAADAVVLHTDGNAFETTVGLVVEAIRVRTGAAAPAATPAVPAPVEPSRHAGRRDRTRRGRKARGPIVQSPIASRMTGVVKWGSLGWRILVRAFVRFRIEGDLAAVPRTGRLIVAGNHASSIDPILVGGFLNQVLDRPLNWLAKREVLEWPVIGWIARRAGVHPVDRATADLEAFRAAMRILESDNILAVFPEGTRSEDGALHSALDGVGMLATMGKARVLPVALIDADRMWPRHQRIPNLWRRVTMRVGTAFDVAEAIPPGTDRRRAKELATRAIMGRIAELLPERQRGVYADAVRPGTPPEGGEPR